MSAFIYYKGRERERGYGCSCVQCESLSNSFPLEKKKCASIMSIVAYHAKLSYDMQTDCIRTIEIEDTKCYKMLIKIKN